jgi:hypothetical protein
VILHAEYDYHTHDYNFNTYECDLGTQSVISTRTRLVSTHKVRFYTKSVLSTHTRVILTRVSVNMTLASEISTRSIVIPTHRVKFLHAVLFRQA